MKRIWFNMAVCAVITSSCSGSKSDDVTPNPPPAPQWYLSETVIRYEYRNNPLIKPGTIDSIVMTYNPDKTLHTHEEFRGPRNNFGASYSLYNAFYDRQKVTKMTYQNSKTGTPEVVNETRYVNNQLVRFFKPGFETTRYDSLVYENNKIVKAVHIDDQPLRSKMWEYTWDNGNLVEIKAYIYVPDEGWKPGGITKIEYTDMPNMGLASAAYGLLWGGAPSIAQLSANTSRSTAAYSIDGKLLYKYARTYSMNENNLPAIDSLWYTDAVAGTPLLYSVSQLKYIDLNKK
ncbi:hypothetical protein HHL17_22190 [Chitinophaga sp. G-6-1-13]|uniref:DUF4595 domain-containing protein n=1 Tax=Chitinophaga fulva TaxID=2728842 RepID=A0A848GPM4_9BACT|nr:hypothetical protein [Chitinophaga fulva]NML39927.1 hypothetical protein [Chitinophaga fulva]